MKRKLSVLLLAAMLASAFSGCGSTEPADTTDPAADSTTDPADVTTADPAADLNVMEQRALIDDELPDKKFTGETFSIYVWGDQRTGMFDVEEETGDIVNDSVYKRQINIEERFDITIEAVDSGHNNNSVNHSEACSQLVLSGDDTYDLYLLHSMRGPNLSLQGGLMNLYDVPYIDFDKPWWPKYVIEEMTFMDQCYVFNSAITENIVSGSVIVFFNRDLITDYKLENPYDLVASGDWTMDKMQAMIKDTYKDLNNNNSVDVEDQFGHMTFIGETYYTPLSSGLDILTKTDDSLELTVNNEKTIKYVEKMYSMMKDPNTNLTMSWNTANLQKAFGESRAIFAYGNISDAGSTYRDSQVNFGMVPYPKLDEFQEDYITFAGRDVYGVPVTVKDPEFAGIIIEALTAEGYKQLLPTYYESALKHKFVRDEEHYEEALEAVDLIEKTASIAFWYMYGDSKLFVNTGTDLMNADSTDFASYYAEKESVAKSRIAEILEFFKDNK